jgi:hypothetical protein
MDESSGRPLQHGWAKRGGSVVICTVSAVGVIMLCAVGVAGCGSAIKTVETGGHEALVAGGESGAAGMRSPIVGNVAGTLLGDEDDDDQPGSYVKGKMLDKDADLDRDGVVRERDGYFDDDDGIVRGYGHPASVPDMHAAKMLIKRYYAMAVAANGATGCSLLYRTYAASVVEDQGSNAGPRYLRGKSCAIVMTKLFKHMSRSLVKPMAIRAVRVRGETAYVLLGSKMRPASYFRLHREGKRWKLYGLLDRPLP